MRTVLVLGDQLSRRTGALARHGPGEARVVMVESRAKLAERPWHRHKLAYVLSAMRHFADELRDAGYEVDYRTADDLRDGLRDVDPADLVVMAPSRWRLRQAFAAWGVQQVPNDAFIVGEDAFAAWADGRKQLTMESFYRRVRADHGWLMDGDEPIAGTWNLDRENREPPPDGGLAPPRPYRPREDDIDARTRRDVARYERELGLELYGEDAPRLFPVTRAEARRSLRSFVATRLDGFGPFQDAVVDGEPFLWHSLLSAPLNLGLLHPAEVCDAVDAHFREHGGPLHSHEGFLRQVCGWREFVWGLYWWRMPAWRADNALGHTGAIPSFYWDADTDMRCLQRTVGDLLDRAWTNHIQRLMILGNHALLAGVDPQALTEWFHALHIDGYDWVMVPNVIGMGQYADGGIMGTRPYVAGGNYINRMTDYCGSCVYDPRTRTEPDSCPFNALYWDFLDRHRSALDGNRRMAPILRNLDRFGEAELDAIRERAAQFRADG